MREPTYLIIVAMASMLVAPPFSGFAQEDFQIVNPPIVDPPIVNLPIVNPPIVDPSIDVAPPIRPAPPLRPQTDATAAPPPPQQPKHAFYYRPGDLKGVRYNTIEECPKASQQAGNVGVCVMK